MGSIRKLVPGREIGLAVLGAASLLVYALLLPTLTYLSSATWMPPPPDAYGIEIPTWLSVDGPAPELVEGQKAQLHAATASQLAIGFTAAYVLYFLALRLARGRFGDLGPTVVAVVAVLLQAQAVLAPYSLSSDVFSYAIYGRIFAVYGGSPYLEPPIQYAGDPFYPYVYWMHVPSFYGPLWTLISGWIVLAAAGDIGAAVFLFRVVQAVSVLLAGVVVYLVLRPTDPSRALTGAVLISWCPLVVVESGLSAHNDVLMSMLIVVGLALAWPRKPIWSIASVGVIVLAGLVKLTALALLPLLGIYLLRSARSWRARAAIFFGSGIVATATAIVIVLPVWSGPETFAVQTLGSGPDRYVNSLAEVVLGELRRTYGATSDDLEVPLQFSGWWVGVHTEALLFATRDGSAVLAPLPVWSDLLVVGPERDGRLRVFDPDSRLVGYVPAENLGPIDAPPERMADPETAARSLGPVGSQDLIDANQRIRGVGWAVFAGAFLLALVVGTGSASRVVVAWAALCLVLDHLTLTWFWPWYVLWGLMPAALVPRTYATRMTLYLGWGVLMLYALMGFMDTRFWYLHNYRALPVFLLPIGLIALDELLRAMWWLSKRLARGRADALSHRAAVRERLTSA